MSSSSRTNPLDLKEKIDRINMWIQYTQQSSKLNTADRKKMANVNPEKDTWIHPEISFGFLLDIVRTSNKKQLAALFREISLKDLAYILKLPARSPLPSQRQEANPSLLINRFEDALRDNQSINDQDEENFKRDFAIINIAYSANLSTEAIKDLIANDSPLLQNQEFVNHLISNLHQVMAKITSEKSPQRQMAKALALTLEQEYLGNVHEQKQNPAIDNIFNEKKRVKARLSGFLDDMAQNLNDYDRKLKKRNFFEKQFAYFSKSNNKDFINKINLHNSLVREDISADDKLSLISAQLKKLDQSNLVYKAILQSVINSLVNLKELEKNIASSPKPPSPSSR